MGYPFVWKIINLLCLCGITADVVELFRRALPRFALTARIVVT